MSRFTNLTKVALTLGAVATLFSACSQKESSSLGPVSPAPLNNGSTRNFTASSVEISGRVTTIDAVARTMQITGQAATIQVATQAEVVLKTNGNETPITLADILPGDSVDVRGDFQGASTFVADRVRKRQNDNANEIEFGGRVVTIDAGARTMTVTGHGELITVAANAEVVSRAQGMEVAISLADINPGDSVEIRGTAQAGGILANRVRLRVQHVEDGIDSEVEFTAAILSIDYAAGTFMVSGHSETITTDSATIIFGRTHDACCMYFHVKQRQARWAEYLLVQGGVQLESATFDSRNAAYPARHAPGWMPPAWSERPAERRPGFAPEGHGSASKRRGYRSSSIDSVLEEVERRLL